ncbi:MAG TPA: hypothetical protein DHW71_02325 [Gammaproteobacteria bacterium]|nr:hypothetical protein [Gammaproteobacteria bacterium]HBF07789.1 hypothetical protein [Gammaproteobacteria bacterium]HCK91791.1 hypothetical protein [Gammaproteobacteria bacterium]
MRLLLKDMIEHICRYTIGLSWIYQGIVPKLWHIAPLERLMTANFGFNAEISDLITRGAGVGEVIFGMAFIVWYRSMLLNIAHCLAMVGLLLFVLVMEPSVMLEAFNPVTTNLPLLALSLILIAQLKTHVKPA